METSLENIGSGAANIASTGGSAPAIAQTEFSAALRAWASGLRSPAYGQNELISLQSATEQIKNAVQHRRSVIDLPLLPHLAGLGMKRELEEFSLSITGEISLPKDTAKSSWLLGRIFGNEDLAVKVDESKIKNLALIKLLDDLRQTLPELTFCYIAKVNKDFDLRCPLYHLRVALAAAGTGSLLMTQGTESVSAAALRVIEETSQERISLGLPKDAPRKIVGAENFNRKHLGKFIKDFDENYRRAKSAGYNRLMAPLNRDNYEGCMEISGDTIFTSYSVTLSSILNIFEPRGGGGHYCCHGSPPNFIWPVPETFISPALEEAKQFLISKGLKPVFFRPSHWLTFGLTGEFPG